MYWRLVSVAIAPVSDGGSAPAEDDWLGNTGAEESIVPKYGSEQEYTSEISRSDETKLQFRDQLNDRNYSNFLDHISETATAKDEILDSGSPLAKNSAICK